MTTHEARLRVLGRFELLVDGSHRELPWQAQRVLGFLAVSGATGQDNGRGNPLG